MSSVLEVAAFFLEEKNFIVPTAIFIIQEVTTQSPQTLEIYDLITPRHIL